MVTSSKNPADTLSPITNKMPATTKERGASLVEYSLLVALISVICIGGVRALGENARDQFNTISQELK